MDGRILTRGRTLGGYELLRTADVETLTVTVLMGGPGSERDVSLDSGRAVARALRAKGHHVIEGDISLADLSSLDHTGVDVVFPALHGPFGEGGQLQDILESRGICFVGSNAASSRLAMDKHRAKQAFAAAGLLTPTGVLIETDRTQAGIATPSLTADHHKQIDKALSELDLPCVIKPNREGSSIGVVIAATADEAHHAAQDILLSYGECLIEQNIIGRELTVGILGGATLPMIELRTTRPFYDYQAKYQDTTTEYIFKIDMPRRQLVAIQRQAQKAFSTLGCSDFGRVDLIVDQQGRGYILEVNTIPGFTEHSLLPKAAKRAQMSMGQLCEQIVLMAHRRPI